MSSLGAGLAPNADILIVMRGIQGGGAALMVPQVLSVIQVNFHGKTRGVALGAYAAVGGFASTISQLLGGWLITGNFLDLGWRMIYLINLPIGIAAFAVASFAVDESASAEAKGKRLDTVGTILVTLALLAFSIPLTFGNDLGWPVWSLTSLLLTPVLIWYFVRYEQKITTHPLTSPLVKLSLFKQRSFSLGNLLVLLFYSGNAALFLALPLLLQNGLGVTAFESGVIFTPLALGFAFMSLTGGRLAEKYGRKTLTAGVLLLGLSYLLFIAPGTFLDQAMSGYELMPASLLAGLAMGLLSAPINYVALRHVQEEEAGSASGILSANLEIAYAIGTVLAGMIFHRVSSGTLFTSSAFLGAFNNTIALNGLYAVLMLAVLRQLRKMS
ncbi:MFS transporter [Paenibacillus thailandensis]|uniref:MFS transporter n=1 Tax=Paenibacillus thailandensis TaxID=393250 RepID=A0ABW5R1X5_9BACL